MTPLRLTLLRLTLLLGFLLTACWANAQAPAPAPAPTQGLQPEWDARIQIDELKRKALTLQPLLEQLSPAKWREAGAPEAYLSQLDGAKRQLQSSTRALDELRQTPEKLGIALEIFLRFQALQNMLDASVEAARKYESPQSADLLQEKLSEMAPARDRFQNYMLELAGERDKQLEVLLKEAQRCRVEVNRPATKK